MLSCVPASIVGGSALQAMPGVCALPSATDKHWQLALPFPASRLKSWRAPSSTRLLAAASTAALDGAVRAERVISPPDSRGSPSSACARPLAPSPLTLASAFTDAWHPSSRQKMTDPALFWPAPAFTLEIVAPFWRAGQVSRG